MKRDFNSGLPRLDGRAGEDADGTAGRGTAHTKQPGAIKYGQAALEISDEMDVERDRVRYDADRARDIRAGRRTTASTKS